MTRMDGKVALVTGAGTGIGRATALAFAEQGAAVVVADVADQEGEATAARIVEAGGQARFVHVDVAEAAEVSAMVEATMSAFGRLDHAFNNAGIEVGPPRWSSALGRTGTARWRSTSPVCSCACRPRSLRCARAAAGRS